MKKLSSRIKRSLRLITIAVLTTLSGLSIVAAPGDLDLSFGSNGFVFDNLGIPFNRGPEAIAMAIQPDGKILVGGIRYTSGLPLSRAVLARFNPNGTRDAAFGSNGVIVEDAVGTYSAISSIIVQPDGKIVVGGGAGSEPPFNFDFLVIRYDANGSRDASFGSNGLVTTRFSKRASAASVLLQPDGKIIAAGRISVGSVPNDAAFAVARYNPNGSSDSSFGADGKVETPLTNAGGYASEAVLQPDGKIVVAGGIYEGATFSDFKRSFGLIRYNSNGSLDATFGSGGIVFTAFTENSEFNSVALQSDGKIVAAGYRVVLSDFKFAVARYDSSGALDSSFGTNGIATTDFSSANLDIAQKVLIQRNGKIIAFGKSGETNNNFALARYNPNGTLDANFGQGGKVVTNTGQESSRAADAALRPDGKIVVVGDTNASNVNRNITLARYLGDVPPGSSFDFDGDGRTDISVFRSGTWHLQRSRLGFTAAGWGVASDKLAPADFDGDGKTDLTVYRPSNGEWSVLRSVDNTIYIIRFGAPEDMPRPADFDGDGKADICVFRPSNGVWYRLNSSNGQFAATAFGQAGDAPLIADFDGDGKSDISVFRPSNGVWYWLRSSDNQFAAVQFGANGDKPVAADYDGDGKTDVAVFRPSNGVWYLQQSTSGFTGIAFGAAEDLPVAADYDGDGKTDVAVFRPSNGVWYLNRSTQGFTGVAFGVSADKPIPNAFVP